MCELEQLAKDGRCALLMPRYAWDESESGRDIPRKSKTWDYFFIGLDQNLHQEHWYEKVENILFPNGAVKRNEKMTFGCSLPLEKWVTRLLQTTVVRRRSPVVYWEMLGHSNN